MHTKRCKLPEAGSTATCNSDISLLQKLTEEALLNKVIALTVAILLELFAKFAIFSPENDIKMNILTVGEDFEEQ